MNDSFNKYYQYDSCSARGICSINPMTSSLQEILILYLKVTAYYAQKLYDINIKNIKARNIILNTISIMVSNYEFSEQDFNSLTNGFKIVLPEIIQEFEKNFSQTKKIPTCLKDILKIDNKLNIIENIKIGEKEFLTRNKKLSKEKRALYQILFILAKSLCINIITLATFDVEEEKGYITILSLLNTIDSDTQKIPDIKLLIKNIAQTNKELMEKLRKILEKEYGIPQQVEVSCSTTPSKAILVVGSNIKELEEILDATKTTDIDIYTHNEMILANTYPKFKEYKNLKGQYGLGIENCLIDYATFPGPIILTRHSLYNVSNLYRGKLFSTDFARHKGIIQIKNKDFSNVIESALKSKGFKTGQQKANIIIGYNFEETINEIINKAKNYKRIFLIGSSNNNTEQNQYFEKILSKTPKNILIITLSYCIKKDNIICVNASFDNYAISRIAEKILEKLNIPLTIFFPECKRHTISQMINLSSHPYTQIFVGNCTPTMLNPNMLKVFRKIFDIESLTTAKKDLDKILNK